MFVEGITTNSTFAGNHGDGYTLMVNGDVNIVNSIFYNDNPYQIKVNPMDGNPNELTTLNIDYSGIKDGMTGIQQAPGNMINFLPTSFCGNPLFLGGDDIHDPLYYSLAAGSPCNIRELLILWDWDYYPTTWQATGVSGMAG